MEFIGPVMFLALIVTLAIGSVKDSTKVVDNESIDLDATRRMEKLGKIHHH